MELLITLLMWLSGMQVATPAATPAPGKLPAATFLQEVPAAGNESLRKERLVERRLVTRSIVIFEDTHFRIGGM